MTFAFIRLLQIGFKASEKMESRPARLFGRAKRAKGRERSTDVHSKGKEEEFIRAKRHPFPQRPKDRVCDFTSYLRIRI